MNAREPTPIDKIISEYINCRELEGDEDPDGELIHAARMQQQEMQTEIERLRSRLLTAAGDDLCRLTQDEIKSLTSGGGKG